MGCQPFQQGWKWCFLRSVPLMYQILITTNLVLKIVNQGYVLQTGGIVVEGKGEDLLRSDMIRKAYLGM